MTWTDAMVTSRRASADQWHSTKTRENIGIALRMIGETPIMCECGAGPFRGPLGISTHRRQKHGTPEQQQRAGGRSHESYPTPPTRYQDIFRAHHGDGPWSCYFCNKPVIKLVVHHKDHDRTNDAIDNLVASHKKCHNDHHGMGEQRVFSDLHRQRIAEGVRRSYERRRAS